MREEAARSASDFEHVAVGTPRWLGALDKACDAVLPAALFALLGFLAGEWWAETRGHPDLKTVCNLATQAIAVPGLVAYTVLGIGQWRFSRQLRRHEVHAKQARVMWVGSPLALDGGHEIGPGPGLFPVEVPYDALLMGWHLIHVAPLLLAVWVVGFVVLLRAGVDRSGATLLPILAILAGRALVAWFMPGRLRVTAGALEFELRSVVTRKPVRFRILDLDATRVVIRAAGPKFGEVTCTPPGEEPLTLRNLPRAFCECILVASLRAAPGRNATCSGAAPVG